MRETWNSFVDKHRGTVFHRWEWMEFLERTLRGKKDPIRTENGLMPVFRGSSVPLADYCGPLGELKKLGEVEIFSLKKLPASTESPFVTFKLEIQDRTYEDVLKNTVHQKHRNMVNRAEREGIRVLKQEPDKKNLKTYYKLYVKTMLRLGRIPLPFSAFGHLIELFGNETELYLAEYDGGFIGGLLVFVYNGRMHIWGNASDRRFGNLGVNNALYAFAIKRACELGLLEIDLGSTAKDSSHHFFKKRWGGREMPIYYRGDHCPDGESGVLLKVLVAILKVNPACVTSLISGVLHKIR